MTLSFLGSLLTTDLSSREQLSRHGSVSPESGNKKLVSRKGITFEKRLALGFYLNSFTNVQYYTSFLVPESTKNWDTLTTTFGSSFVLAHARFGMIPGEKPISR